MDAPETERGVRDGLTKGLSHSLFGLPTPPHIYIFGSCTGYFKRVEACAPFAQGHPNARFFGHTTVPTCVYTYLTSLRWVDIP
jgi:hypothetical protein